MKKTIAILGVVALVLGVSAVAFAQTATEDTVQTPPALQQLVDDGVITQQQAEAVNQAMFQSRAGFRHGGPLGPNLEVVAEALGTDVDTLKADLADGKTIAEIAESNGVDIQTVINAVVSAASERIDAAVEAGRIPAEDAATMKAQVAERVQDMVNRAPGSGDCDGDGPHGPGGFRGMGAGMHGGPAGGFQGMGPGMNGGSNT